MKKILLTASIFAFLFSNAQKNIYLYPQRILKKFQSYQSPKKDFQKEWNDRFKNLAKTLPQPRLLYTLKDDTKVFSLSQDNMVCLVPDMKQFNMPNASYPSSFFELQKQPGRIPNATIPLLILPKE